MRVLLISQGFPKYAGDSTAPFMASIVEGLAARGHELDVLLPHHPEFQYPERDGVRFLDFRYSPVHGVSPWGFGSSLRGTSRVAPQALLLLPAVVASLRRRVTGLLAERPYDIVHANWLLPNAWVAAAPAARHAVPLVASLHGSDVAMAERTAPLRWIARRTFAATGAVTAPSDDLRSRAERLGANPATSRTVHYGVDCEAFAPGRTAPGVRDRLGAPPGALLVVAVGRLVEKKGFRHLVEAVSQVEGVQLALVGDGPLRAELEAAARGAPVTFAGDLDRDAVAVAVAAADVVAVPSVVDGAGNVDGLPNTLLEALSAGRPVVASSVAGIPEVVADRENGLLVPEKNPGALAAALAELRDRPELRTRLGTEARRRALEELSWDATVEAMEQAYAAAGAVQVRAGSTR